MIVVHVRASSRPDCADDRDTEWAINSKWMEELAVELKTREPKLIVELLLMDLDGSVERIS